jgi:hypothetical protein
VATNTIGQGQAAFTLPRGPAAGPLHVQVASIDPSAPNGLFALSNGVRVDLQ